MTPSVTIAAVVPADEAHGRPRSAAAIARALACEGGHLAIGHGGYTNYHDQGWLGGCCPDAVKPMALAAGLPVIDARHVPFEEAARLATGGPMVAVGRAADPSPYDALSYAPLAFVGALYRRAGAEVCNVPACRLAARSKALPPTGAVTARRKRAKGPGLLYRLWSRLRARAA